MSSVQPALTRPQPKLYTIDQILGHTHSHSHHQHGDSVKGRYQYLEWLDIVCR